MSGTLAGCMETRLLENKGEARICDQPRAEVLPSRLDFSLCPCEKGLGFRRIAGAEGKLFLTFPYQLPEGIGSPLSKPKDAGLSDMTLNATMKRLHETDIEEDGTVFFDHVSERVAVPHGLRSTFRDWTAERTEYPRELAETALAHKMTILSKRLASGQISSRPPLMRNGPPPTFAASIRWRRTSGGRHDAGSTRTI